VAVVVAVAVIITLAVAVTIALALAEAEAVAYYPRVYIPQKYILFTFVSTLLRFLCEQNSKTRLTGAPPKVPKPKDLKPFGLYGYHQDFKQHIHKLGATTLSIMALSLKDLSVTLGIITLCHYAECNYVE
jgi:hypothetical protein